MLSELLRWNGGIIAVPEGAKYSQQEALNVLAYAATSTNNSPEAAANELRRKMPTASVPDADTVHSYIKTANSIEEILSFYRALNSVFLPLLKIPNTPHRKTLPSISTTRAITVTRTQKACEESSRRMERHGGTFISLSTGWAARLTPWTS